MREVLAMAEVTRADEGSTVRKMGGLLRWNVGRHVRDRWMLSPCAFHVG